MKLEDQVCSLELAKKMKELGFEQESLYWWDEKDNEIYRSVDGTVKNIGCFSAYTVAELGKMLPWNIVIHRDINFGWHITYHCDDRLTTTIIYIISYQANGLTEKDMKFSEDLSEANARAKMLIYLKENNLLAD